MRIEEIARAVAAEWQMSFDGIELDFALEVAKRAVEAEREACAKVCDYISDGYDSRLEGRSGIEAAQAIRARPN